jgi:hypothetical protein
VPRHEHAHRIRIASTHPGKWEQRSLLYLCGARSPEFRRKAVARGAQLSTSDMLELVDNVVKYLGEKT